MLAGPSPTGLLLPPQSPANPSQQLRAPAQENGPRARAATAGIGKQPRLVANMAVPLVCAAASS
jgi:hypothetical protein